LIAAVGQGLTPLEYLTSVYRDESIDVQRRVEAAKAAAPFVHPKLSQVQVEAATDLKNLTDEQLAEEVAMVLGSVSLRQALADIGVTLVKGRSGDPEG
jgi:hypothetical protein